MSARPAPRRRRTSQLVAVLAAALALAGCGVEVPDDVAARATSTSTTTEPASITTDVPRSDDELEQALIDNGYTLAEARCGAENLRTELDADEIREIVEADTIEDIDPGIAADFARALQGCVEDGADVGGAGDGDRDEDPPADDEPPREEERPGEEGEGEEGGGEEGGGDVSRSRFLSELLASGMPDEAARCVVEEVYARFDQETINDIYWADTAEGLPSDVVEEFTDLVAACS